MQIRTLIKEACTCRPTYPKILLVYVGGRAASLILADLVHVDRAAQRRYRPREPGTRKKIAKLIDSRTSGSTSRVHWSQGSLHVQADVPLAAGHVAGRGREGPEHPGVRVPAGP